MTAAVTIALTYFLVPGGMAAFIFYGNSRTTHFRVRRLA
jgi:hypothetical protein